MVKRFSNRRRLLPVYGALILIVGLAALPMERPLLSPKNYIRIFGGNPTGNVEELQLGILLQNFSTRFGWEEMTQKVAKVYGSLSEDVSEITPIPLEIDRKIVAPIKEPFTRSIRINSSSEEKAAFSLLPMSIQKTSIRKFGRLMVHIKKKINN